MAIVTGNLKKEDKHALNFKLNSQDVKLRILQYLPIFREIKFIEFMMIFLMITYLKSKINFSMNMQFLIVLAISIISASLIFMLYQKKKKYIFSIIRNELLFIKHVKNSNQLWIFNVNLKFFHNPYFCYFRSLISNILISIKYLT